MFESQVKMVAGLRENYSDKFVFPQPETPQELVAQITAVLSANKNAKVLVLFTIEWALYLREIGYTDICVSTKGDATVQKLCQVLGFVYQDISEITKHNMKFDVVVSNPPYDAPIADTQQTKKIWIEFVKLAIDLTKTNGSTGIVCPSSWIGSNDAKLKKLRNQILEKNVPAVRVDIQSEFPGAPGVQIGWFVMLPGEYTSTNFQSLTVSGNFNLTQGMPKSATDGQKDALLNKIINSSTAHYQFELNDKPSKDNSAPGLLKVVANYSRAYYSQKTTDNNMPITTDPINNKQGYILINTTDEGINHKSFLHSRAIVWFVNNYKRSGQTGFYDAVKRNVIPKFETKLWTDADVYRVLNLTQDEIELIEATVK